MSTVLAELIRKAARDDLPLYDLPNGYVSHSSIGSHSRCMKQYEFRYHMHAPELIGTGLTLGSAVHLALEFSDVEQIRTGKRWTPQQAGSQAAEAVPMLIQDAIAKGNTIEWRAWKETHPDFKGKKRKSKDDPPFPKIEVNETEAMLAADAYALAAAYELEIGPLIRAVAAEVEYKIPFPEHGITARGFIDTILDVTLPGQPVVRGVITDRKTGRRYEKAHADEAKRSTQITRYDGAAVEMTIPSGGVQIHRGTVSKDGTATWRMTPIEPRRTRDQIQSLLMNDGMRAQLMRTGIYPKTEDGRTCGFCGYRKICKPDWYAGEAPEGDDE